MASGTWLLAVSRRVCSVLCLVLLAAPARAQSEPTSLGRGVRPPSRPGIGPGAQEAPAAASLEKWLDALSAGAPVEVLVAFKPVEAGARSSAVHPEAGAADESASIERRALEYANLKSQALSHTSRRDDIDVLSDYSHLPILFLRIHSAEALRSLAAQPEVFGLFEDRVSHMFAAPNLVLIGQPVVASRGYTGTGTSVAVLDGSVDYSNTAFGCVAPGNPANCVVSYAQSFGTGGNRDARDHATNVAGIVHEVAPAAKILSLDVFSGDTTNDSTWMQAANWCIANKATYNIAATNMSFGSGAYDSPCYQYPAESVMDALRQAGIIPVVSAGNSGSSDALAYPACAPSSISVGAVYTSAYGPITWTDTDQPSCTDYSTETDQVPCFSQSAPFLTALAPGAIIEAADLGYGGTSQAAPHMAGAIAVLRSAFSTEPLGHAIARILTTGRQITDRASGVTTPRLQLDAATFGPFPDCKTHSVSLPFYMDGNLLSDTCVQTSSSGLVWYLNVYPFIGSAGQRVWISMTSSTIDTYLELIAPDGTWAASDSAVPGVSLDTQINFTLTTAGTWTIVASSYFPSTAGRYTVRGATVTGAPAAAFEVSPDELVPGRPIQFTDTSTGTPTSWQWDFGDSSGSTSQNPSYSYLRSGTYVVTLTVSNTLGSSSASRTLVIAPCFRCTRVLPARPAS